MRENFKINGKTVELELTSNEILLHALRKNGYTEVKNGCEEGDCGACLVLIDGVAVNSCQILAMSVKDKEIMTVKGIGDMHKISVLQETFVEAGAVQCGFCTPGFIIAVTSLLNQNPNPTDDEIKTALDGNLCRCTGYLKIFDAVKMAIDRLAKGGK